MLARRGSSARGGVLTRFLRPPAIWVAGVGVAASLAVLVLPPLSAYADGWYLLLGLTIVCYVLLALGQDRPGLATPRVKDRDLDTVLRLRREMETRLSGLPEDSYLTRDLPGLLAHLDSELIPGLTSLVARRQALASRLAEYDDRRPGALRPDEATLTRLRGLHDRQNRAVREVVQQVVNMDAALLGLLEEGDESRIAGQVQEWAQEIDVRWQTVAEVLGTEEPRPRGA